MWTSPKYASLIIRPLANTPHKFANRMNFFSLAPLNVALLAALSLATVLALHGAHLPVEKLINRFASFGRTAAGICLGG